MRWKKGREEGREGGRRKEKRREEKRRGGERRKEREEYICSNRKESKSLNSKLLIYFSLARGDLFLIKKF